MEQRIRFQQLYIVECNFYGHKVHSMALFVTRASVTSVSRGSRKSRDRGHGELGCHVTPSVCSALLSLPGPLGVTETGDMRQLSGRRGQDTRPQFRPRNGTHLLHWSNWTAVASGADRVELTQPRSITLHNTALWKLRQTLPSCIF